MTGTTRGHLDHLFSPWANDIMNEQRLRHLPTVTDLLGHAWDLVDLPCIVEAMLGEHQEARP
jgi:hypothetical protein